MKKIIACLYLGMLVLAFIMPTGVVLAQSDIVREYELLAPLPCDDSDPNCQGGQLTSFDAGQKNPLGGYLNTMIRIFIGISAVLAVVMIVIGGIEYMTSELVSSKESGKSKITNAVLGLILALGAYALLYTINPNLLVTDLKSLATVDIKASNQIAGRLGQGKCEPVADSNNVCHPSKLQAAFGNKATQASSICNGESSAQVMAASGVDKGSDGKSFSFGLFQINIIAHASAIGNGQVCNDIFEVDPNPPGKIGTSGNDTTLGGCLERKDGICLKYAAKVKDQSKYNSCIQFITKPEENIKFAASLQSARGWGQWGYNASCRF